MKKVLVVDDTKNIRMILTKCLELEGYEVVTASDGKQALALFTSQPFDLAFLDIKLPEVRGTEVLKRIRELGIQTPVIIITAYATVKNAVDCTNLGAVAYVQKPFSADKIRSVLREFDQRPTPIKKEHSDPTSISTIKEILLQKEYDKALEMAKSSLPLHLDNAEIYLLLSEAYKGLGDTQNADRFYQFYLIFYSKDQL